MSIRVSAVSQNNVARNCLKSVQKKAKSIPTMTIMQTSKAGAILVTSSLAALSGVDFLSRTTNEKQFAGEHYEWVPPSDSSDYPHYERVKDPYRQQYIPGSGSVDYDN